MGRQVAPLDLLISDVVMERMDGFALREALHAIYPNLQTVFVTGYDVTGFDGGESNFKILKKPINPHEVLAAIELAEQNLQIWKASAAKAAAPPIATSHSSAGASSTAPPKNTSLLRPGTKQGLVGQLDQFQIVDILQMCCLSRRTGRLRVAKGVERGVIFVSDGAVVHAVCGDLEGEDAVYRIIGWQAGEFSMDEGVPATKQSIRRGWEHVIMEGVRRRDEATPIESSGEPEETVRTSLGAYQLLRKLGEGKWGEVYLAVQTSMQRQVAMKILWKHLTGNTDAVQQFIADASAKANVLHPSILPVYEAGEEGGSFYYSREYVDGTTLADLIAQGTRLDGETALRVTKTVAEAFSYLAHQRIPHEPIEPQDIFIGNDGLARVANLATVSGDPSSNPQDDIRALGTIMHSATLGADQAAPGLRALITRMMVEGPNGFLSWGALMQGVVALEPKFVPQDAYKLSEQDHAAIQAVEAEKQRQKRSGLLAIIAISVLAIVVLGILYRVLFYVPKATVFDQMVEVPTGTFLYQEGQKVDLPAFWIDKYEVSVGMYARFLEALEAQPTVEFDHPNQPRGKTHKPRSWDQIYFAVTRGDRKWQGAPISLNSPVFNLDWFDAYAYSKWVGKRLPTEQEWEKAGRGTLGFRYPWGNDWDPKRVNGPADFNFDRPKEKGKVDGWNFWAPVNAMKADLSPFGVVGMCGNVFEWTGSWDSPPGKPTEVLPVVRGGSFNALEMELAHRNVALNPLQFDLRLGFRCASDIAPQTK